MNVSKEILNNYPSLPTNLSNIIQFYYNYGKNVILPKNAAHGQRCNSDTDCASECCIPNPVQKECVIKNICRQPRLKLEEKCENDHDCKSNCCNNDTYSCDNYIKCIEKKTQQSGSIKMLKSCRKHQGIIQNGKKRGKLKKGYKYIGKKTKSGLPIIKKVKT